LSYPEVAMKRSSPTRVIPEPWPQVSSPVPDQEGVTMHQNMNLMIILNIRSPHLGGVTKDKNRRASSLPTENGA
jgi:hypothetical protein